MVVPSIWYENCSMTIMESLVLGKPVIAVNAATYWHALRANNIDDKVAGFGRLLEDF